MVYRRDRLLRHRLPAEDANAAEIASARSRSRPGRRHSSGAVRSLGPGRSSARPTRLLGQESESLDRSSCCPALRLSGMISSIRANRSGEKGDGTCRGHRHGRPAPRQGSRPASTQMLASPSSTSSTRSKPWASRAARTCGYFLLPLDWSTLCLFLLARSALPASWTICCHRHHPPPSIETRTEDSIGRAMPVTADTRKPRPPPGRL